MSRGLAVASSPGLADLPAADRPARRPARFECASCGHVTDLHPRPESDLTTCAQCVAEEDLGQRDEAAMCRLRYPRP